MVKPFPNIDDQTAALRRDFPSFVLLKREGNVAALRGDVKPLMRTYTIVITYRMPLVVERLDLLSTQPRVRVVRPQLLIRPGDPEGDLPHVYWLSPTDPILCLFDPETSEWTPHDLLSKTTVPYAIDWLACYEGWRATGSWTGGGRHAQLLQSGARQ